MNQLPKENVCKEKSMQLTPPELIFEVIYIHDQ